VLLTMVGGDESRADDVMVTNAPRHPEFEGKTLREMGEMQGLPPQEAGVRLVREEPSAVAIIFEMCEEDVRQVMRHPFSMFGSDGLPSGAGKPHPRLYGTFARVLGTYVREEKVLGLEEAVRKMTELPARKHRLEGRGQIAPGCWGDVTIFDPQTVEDVATYQDPRRHPEGIRYVIVNGEVVVDGGRHTGAPAGRLLRAGS
jgi:N-acyl-D-amino-acid deacylase